MASNKIPPSVGKKQGILRVGKLLARQRGQFVSSAESVGKKMKKYLGKSSSTSEMINENIDIIDRSSDELIDSQERIYEKNQSHERWKKSSEKSPSIAKPISKMVGGLLRKPLEIFKKLLLGLLLYNLPKIVLQIKDTWNKMRLFSRSFSAYMTRGKNFIRDSFQIIQAVYQNAINFDFNDESKRYETAIKNAERNAQKDQAEIERINKMWDLDAEELDKQLNLLDQESRELDRRAGVEPQETMTGDPASSSQSASSGQSGTGTSIVNASPEEYRIAAAIATEAGRGKSATDVLQVAANRVADSRYPSNYTDVFAQRGQFQGVFSRNLSTYRQIDSAESAASWVGGGMSPAIINGYIRDIRDQKNRQSSAELVGGALEFRAAPQYYIARPNERPSGTGMDGRIPNSTWRGGRGDNQILRDPSQDPMRAGGAAPINYTQTPTTQSPVPAGSAIQPAGSTTDANILNSGDMVSGYQVSSPFGMRSHPTKGGMRNHGGLDIATPTGTYIALKVDCEVMATYNQSGGYGLGIDVWVPSLGLQFRFAHNSQILKSSGKIAAGTPFARSGGAKGDPNAGTSTGPHIHFEVDTKKNGTNYGGANDPKLLAKGAQYLILSSSPPTPKMISKLSLDGISSKSISAEELARLDYDPDANVDKINNTQVVVAVQPIVATKTQVVTQTIEKTKMVPIRTGGSAIDAYNKSMLSNMV